MDKKQLAFAPSSLILANNFLPVNWALCSMEAMLKIRVPAWEGLRKIGQSKLISLTIFIPVIGYMIIFNEQLILLFELSKDLFSNISTIEIGEGISQDNKTRLFYFYFGFTFLGVGSLLYQLFCPSIIKEHGSDREFIREEVDLMTGKRTWLVLEFLKNNAVDKERDFQDIDRLLETQGTGSTQSQKENLNAAKTDIMLMQWQFENWSNNKTRCFIALFYSLGFGILIVPSLEMFYKVFLAFIN